MGAAAVAASAAQAEVKHIQQQLEQLAADRTAADETSAKSEQVVRAAAAEAESAEGNLKTLEAELAGTTGANKEALQAEVDKAKSRVDVAVTNAMKAEESVKLQQPQQVQVPSVAAEQALKASLIAAQKTLQEAEEHVEG